VIAVIARDRRDLVIAVTFAPSHTKPPCAALMPDFCCGYCLFPIAFLRNIRGKKSCLSDHQITRDDGDSSQASSRYFSIQFLT
jgi:hypothetical protein